MGTLVNRSLSLLIYIGYLVGLLLPMGCIWFAEAFGGYKGMAHYQVIDTPTPAILICACGWFMLIGLPILLYITR
jgi:hypothetical protein